MADIGEILRKAEEVTPIAERGGRQIMSFDDQMALATKENMESMTNKAMGKKDGDLGGLKWNSDGSLARTRGNAASVNLDSFYNNRFKKIKNKYYVVIDKLAIAGLRDNKVPYPHIEAYLIGENEGKIVCEKKVTISDKEFVADYTHKLDHASMKMVLDAIADFDIEKETESLAF